MSKKSSVTIIHLIMMFLMMFGTIGGAANFIIGAVGSETSSALLSNITNIVLMAVILSMLIMGAVYIIKDYSKPAAVFYKAFMFLHVYLTGPDTLARMELNKYLKAQRK